MSALYELTPLLISAAQLLVIGMSFVFAFLAILIWAVKLLSKYAATSPLEAESQGGGAALPSKFAEPDPAVIAAISAAVIQHRNRNKA